MDNRLQILSLLMLLAMLSIMAFQSPTITDTRQPLAYEPNLAPLPTALAMAMERAGWQTSVSDASEE